MTFHEIVYKQKADISSWHILDTPGCFADWASFGFDLSAPGGEQVE